MQQEKQQSQLKNNQLITLTVYSFNQPFPHYILQIFSDYCKKQLITFQKYFIQYISKDPSFIFNVQYENLNIKSQMIKKIKELYKKSEQIFQDDFEKSIQNVDHFSLICLVKDIMKQRATFSIKCENPSFQRAFKNLKQLKNAPKKIQYKNIVKSVQKYLQKAKKSFFNQKQELYYLEFIYLMSNFLKERQFYPNKVQISQSLSIRSINSSSSQFFYYNSNYTSESTQYSQHFSQQNIFLNQQLSHSHSNSNEVVNEQVEENLQLKQQVYEKNNNGLQMKETFKQNQKKVQIYDNDDDKFQIYSNKSESSNKSKSSNKQNNSRKSVKSNQSIKSSSSKQRKSSISSDESNISIVSSIHSEQEYLDDIQDINDIEEPENSEISLMLSQIKEKEKSQIQKQNQQKKKLQKKLTKIKKRLQYYSNYQNLIRLSNQQIIDKLISKLIQTATQMTEVNLPKKKNKGNNPFRKRQKIFHQLNEQQGIQMRIMQTFIPGYYKRSLKFDENNENSYSTYLDGVKLFNFYQEDQSFDSQEEDDDFGHEQYYYQNQSLNKGFYAENSYEKSQQKQQKVLSDSFFQISNQMYNKSQNQNKLRPNDHFQAINQNNYLQQQKSYIQSCLMKNLNLLRNKIILSYFNSQS